MNGSADPSSPESQFVEHLAHIQRVSRFTARRVGLGVEEVDECVSWIQLRLIENDYAAIRKFRGESSFKTYITVVIAKLTRDYRVQLHGRWRPSSKAVRLGPVAVTLERLMHRDGLTFEQATETIRSASTLAPDVRELRDLLRQLPPRPPLRPSFIDVDASKEEAARDRADGGVEESERVGQRERMVEAMRTEIERLTPEDRLALEMHVVDGVTVAGIARALGMLQRPLYDRLHSLKKSLGQRLRARGISDEDVRTLTEGDVS